jgi:menaquinone-dependent protoporphyrinogen oxidase
MKTIVVYDTKYGSTRETALKLAKAIGEGVSTCDLSKEGAPNISGFDAVLLGGPVYAGSWSKRASAFARGNQEALAKKRFAAFSTGFAKEKGMEALKGALPAPLAQSAVALSSLGGAIIFSRMNPIERFIMKAISKSSADSSSVDEAAIAGLARDIKGGKR